MFKRLFGIAAVLSAFGVLAVGAGPASAQTGNPFGCTATTAKATLLGQNLLPGATTANAANTPCANDAQTLNATTVNPLGLIGLTAGPASATTKLTTRSVNGSTVYTDATATSSVDALSLTAPGLSIAITTPSQAKVEYACVNDALVPSASSTLNVITINGNTIPLSGLPQDLSIPGVATIQVNQKTTTGDSTTEELLHVQLLGLVATGLTLDAGSATASASGSAPCAGTTDNGGGGGNGAGGGSGGGNGGGNGGNGCPVGSTPTAGATCTIPAGSEDNRKAIVFNAGNITGGNVMSLALARHRYKSLCLNGAGPKYAVVGNSRNNRITVRNVRERVLGLGGRDRVTVSSGNHTCVDGGTGNDTVKAGKAPIRVYGSNGNDKITVGNGKDVVYGGGGQDRIHAGNGNDSLNGGGGNDTIVAGNGNDHLYGNVGADKLTAGTGRDFLFGARGNDRLTARGKHAYANGGSGHNTAYVRAGNAKFAHKHGCKKVHVL
ncbi:MAG TPA: choice-of-anchor P family protein [Solirubrobacteraceae bacterium]|nr:choice-of-anchor P family protein [Solirubrobacteraceae bacterium]